MSTRPAMIGARMGAISGNPRLATNTSMAVVPMVSTPLIVGSGPEGPPRQSAVIDQVADSEVRHVHVDHDPRVQPEGEAADTEQVGLKVCPIEISVQSVNPRDRIDDAVHVMREHAVEPRWDVVVR